MWDYYTLNLQFLNEGESIMKNWISKLIIKFEPTFRFYISDKNVRSPVIKVLKYEKNIRCKFYSILIHSYSQRLSSTKTSQNEIRPKAAQFIQMAEIQCLFVKFFSSDTRMLDSALELNRLPVLEFEPEILTQLFTFSFSLCFFNCNITFLSTKLFFVINIFLFSYSLSCHYVLHIPNILA